MSDTETRCRLTPEQRAEEAAFIRSTDGWPLWPTLPIKRPRQGAWPELGELRVNPSSDTGTLPEPLEVLVHDGVRIAGLMKYATVDALLDDGWVVD